MKINDTVRFKDAYSRYQSNYTIAEIKPIAAIKHDPKFKWLVQNLQSSRLAYQDDDLIAEIKPVGSKSVNSWTPINALELVK